MNKIWVQIIKKSTVTKNKDIVFRSIVGQTCEFDTRTGWMKCCCKAIFHCNAITANCAIYMGYKYNTRSCSINGNISFITLTSQIFHRTYLETREKIEKKKNKSLVSTVNFIFFFRSKSIKLYFMLIRFEALIL